MNAQQPRTPAGSPEGGQFAESSGAESQIGLLEVVSGAQSATDIAMTIQDRQRSRYDRILALQDEQTHEAVDSTVWALRGLCPHVQSVQWEWCGDSDAPTALGNPAVTCKHVEVDGNEGYASTTLYDFAHAHGVTNPAALDAIDSLGADIDENHMRRFCAANSDRATEDHGRFTVTTAIPTYSFEAASIDTNCDDAGLPVMSGILNTLTDRGVANVAKMTPRQIEDYYAAYVGPAIDRIEDSYGSLR